MVIDGKIERLFFAGENTAAGVLRLEDPQEFADGFHMSVRFFANIFEAKVGQKLSLDGEYIKDPKWGYQFQGAVAKISYNNPASIKKLLESGEAVVIYPEGRLSEDGRLGPLSPGVVTLAMRTGVPVYPIVTVGSDKFLPRGAKWVRTAYKEVHYGRPLSFEPLNKHGAISVKEQVDAANERLRQALLELY